jgi:hypothetical protein
MAKFRTVIITFYGMMIGLAYAAILAIAFPRSVIITVILSVIVVAIFSLYSIRLAKFSEMPNWRLALLMPLIPFAMLGGIIAFGFIFVNNALIPWRLMPLDPAETAHALRLSDGSRRCTNTPT